MLSLVLPTYNESATIVMLLETVGCVLRDIPHEVIVVDDDSPDGTWKVATDFAARRARIKVLRRIGKRGLSSAVVDGFDAAHGTMLAVMDADGQHDASLLPGLVRMIEHGATAVATAGGGADIALGSRYVPGGSVGDWVADRRIISGVGAFLARRLSRVPVSDPLSGFFVVRRDLYERVREQLRPTGFKILLEILASIPSDSRLTESPLVFRMRFHGQSKLSFSVHVAFVCQILRLALRQWTPATAAFGAWLFLILTITAAMLTVPRTLALRLLYTDATVRASVQRALTAVADKHGWLLSDIELTSLTADAASIEHRDHLRHATVARHCRIDLHTSALLCDD